MTKQSTTEPAPKKENGSKPLFHHGIYSHGGVQFPLPTISTLFDRLRELSGQQLMTLAETNSLPWHPEMPRAEIEFALASVIQAQWYDLQPPEKLEPVLLAKITQCRKTYTERYREICDKLNKGETIVANKKKAVKKAAKEPKVKTVLTYEIDAAKARQYEEGKFVKEVDGKLDDSYAAHIVRVLLDNGKRMTFPDLRDAVAKTVKAAKTSRAHTDAIYSNCRKLAKAKLLDYSKQPAAAA